MTRRAPLALAPFCLALIALLAGALAAQELPPGFVRERVGSTFDGPIALAFLDEHRLLVAERAGRVWFVDHDVKRNLVHDLTGETNQSRNRGLFGLAAAPDFGDGGWIYLLHSVRVPGELPWGPGYARLVRVRAELDERGDLVARPETRQILLGETWATGIASCVDDHTLGSLRFPSDGSLVLSTGDNTSPGLDTGGMQPDCFLPGTPRCAWARRSFRSGTSISPTGASRRAGPCSHGTGATARPTSSRPPSTTWTRARRTSTAGRASTSCGSWPGSTAR